MKYDKCEIAQLSCPRAPMKNPNICLRDQGNLQKIESYTLSCVSNSISLPTNNH